MPPANVYSVSQVSANSKSQFVSVLVAAFVAHGGETKLREGAQLLTVCATTAFFFVPV